VCFDVSFERIRTLAEDGGLPEAHRRTGCGGRCGLCLPYIQLMLTTGETVFPVMWAEDFARLGIKAGRIHQIQHAFAIHRHATRPAVVGQRGVNIG